MQFVIEEKKDRNDDLSHLEQVLVSIRDAVIVADSKGIIFLANPTSELITGYLPLELLGKRIQDTLQFTSQKGDDISWFLSEALEGWRAVELPEDSLITRHRGAPLPVAGTATPLYAPEGTYKGIVLVLRDLTEEARLKRRQYEFLSFISHQLRQPMGSFRWGIEILLKESERLDPRQKELLEDLLGTSVRFADFIRNLVDVSRFEEGRVEFKIAKVDIRGIVKETCEELKGLAVSHNVSVKAFGGLDPTVAFFIKGDRDRLRDVFLNLFTNAIRYNRPRGEVICEASMVGRESIERLLLKNKGSAKLIESVRKLFEKHESEKEFLLVSIKDTGIGIPEKEQINMFESFFRASNVVEKGFQGTGLGMFIVRSIVERVGGSIFFESQENVGTTFYLIFPPYRESTP